MASKPPCDYIDEGSSSPDEDDSEFFSSAGEDDDGNYDMFTGAVVSTVGDTTFDQSRTEYEYSSLKSWRYFRADF